MGNAKLEVNQGLEEGDTGEKLRRPSNSGADFFNDVDGELGLLTPRCGVTVSERKAALKVAPVHKKRAVPMYEVNSREDKSVQVQ